MAPYEQSLFAVKPLIRISIYEKMLRRDTEREQARRQPGRLIVRMDELSRQLVRLISHAASYMWLRVKKTLTIDISKNYEEKTTSYHKTASIPRQSSRHARPGLPPRPPVMFRVPRARRGDISGGRGGPLSSPRRVGISVARPRARLHRGEDPRTFRTKHEHDVDAHGSYRDDPRPGHGDRRRVRGSCRGRGARGSARACHFVGRRRRVPSDPPRKNDVTRRRVEKEREKV